MSRGFSHQRWIATVCLLATLSLPVFAADRNVLLIIADDFGVDAAPGYSQGTNKPPMPNLTSLQASGVTYTRAWANPLCSPTRATLLSGRYGFRTGVQYVALASNTIGLRTNEPTIAKALDSSSVDIQSAAFGKWHLANFGSTNPTPADHPIRMGFDRYAGNLTSTLSSYTSWTKIVNTSSEIETSSTSTTYATSDVTDEALAWINDQGDDNWFAWVAYNAAHSPYHKAPNDLHSQDLLPATGGDPRDYYETMCEAMDTEMGRLINGLSTTVRSKTTIIFVGDNGTPASAPFGSTTTPIKSGGFRDAKFSIYEGGINVPLVVSGAGVGSPGRTNNSLINTTDIFATVMGIHGIRVADVDEGLTMDTISFLPTVTSSTGTTARTESFAEIRPQGGTFPYNRTVRNSRYKLLRFSTGSSLTLFREEFYDLQDNPQELSTRDLIGRPLTVTQQNNLTSLRNRLNALSR
jgi:arylsulfatase A-like enzyme